jgi:hypothetical protein
MSDSINVKPIVQAEATIKRAASVCCGAMLDVINKPETGVSEPVTFSCQKCGQPCGITTSRTERVILHGR